MKDQSSCCKEGTCCDETEGCTSGSCCDPDFFVAVGSDSSVKLQGSGVTLNASGSVFVGGSETKTVSDLVPGDIVQIKSGGPLMTVSSELVNNGFYCQWFSSNSYGYSATGTSWETALQYTTMHSEWFHKNSLRKIS